MRTNKRILFVGILSFFIITIISLPIIINYYENNNKNNDNSIDIIQYDFSYYFSIHLNPDNESVPYTVIFPFWNISNLNFEKAVKNNITFKGNGTFQFIKYSPPLLNGFNDTSILIKGTGKITFDISIISNWYVGSLNLTLYTGIQIDDTKLYCCKCDYNCYKNDCQYINLTLIDDQIFPYPLYKPRGYSKTMLHDGLDLFSIRYEN